MNMNSVKLAFCITFGVLLAGACVFAQGSIKTQYRYNNIKLKQPVISKSMIPAVTKYKKGNYLGAMVDLEELIKKEQNNTTAKYYLALCYTQLGYEGKANDMYRNVVEANDNYVLTYFSQRAMDCTGKTDNSENCAPPKRATIPAVKVGDNNSENSENSDIDAFIQSGMRMHPSVVDRITKDRMERKIQADEYMKKQEENQANNPS